MAGSPQQQIILNKTLLYIAQLLIKHNIVKWFIAYGTLLGIVRNHSCIANDDDVDIMCDYRDKELLKQIFIKNGFTVTLAKKHFFRIVKNDYAPIDFYCAHVNGDDYHDKWDHIMWKNASLHGEFIKKKWNDIYLQLPHQYVSRLRNQYGRTWRTPIKNYKGTRKKQI